MGEQLLSNSNHQWAILATATYLTTPPGGTKPLILFFFSFKLKFREKQLV